MQTARTMFAVVAWLFVGLVALQVFLAGLGLFGATDMSLHRDAGYFIPLVALVVLIAGLVARAGSRTNWLAGGLLLVSSVQTSLPYLREDLPFIAALHPVNALLIFWLGLVIAHRATALSRGPVDADDHPAAASADTASI